MTEEKKVEAEVVEKGQRFNCGICGKEWSSLVKRSGVRLCKTCVELRRAVNTFLGRGVEVEDLKERIAKILE